MNVPCKIENDKTIFNGDGEVIYFVPEKYFDLKVAQVYGKYVELLGIFDYALYDAKGKKLRFNRFFIPTVFKCMPREIRKEKGMLLETHKEAADYRLLCFSKGDELISANHVSKDIDNVEKFINLLFRGNLPDNIPYDEITTKYMMENAAANNFNYKVPPQLLALIPMVLYRDSKDPSKEFRFSDTDDMTDYKAVPITKAAKYVSPYHAITSENADEAVAFAMTTKSHTPSPLEHIMMEGAQEDYENPYDPDDFFSEEFVPLQG